MSTLGSSPRERFISRICFYALVAAIMWTGNLMRPDFDAIRAEKLIAQGVAQPMIGVPVPNGVSFRRVN
ncbi:hypothetical protein VSU19_02905 [Verrucomicrobiales bacterium BCK34]|nr:hypothetical protein [Verrucomicrobiales bacterium BCK34]